MTDKQASPVPTVLYHGTARPFESFRADLTGSRHADVVRESGEDVTVDPTAFYFTDDLATAIWYARDSARQDGIPESEGVVMEVRVALANPKVVQFGGAGREYLAEEIISARQSGCDGVICLRYDDGGVSNHYIAFHAHQLEIVKVQKCKEIEQIKTDNRPIKGDNRLFLEDMGYDIDEDPDQPGLWQWTAPSDGCESSFDSAKEALDDAWRNAVHQTLAITGDTQEEFERMDFDQQRIAVTVALTGEVPPFDDLSMDTQMEWVEKVRELYPDIGPKETLLLAKQEYRECDGVLPKPASVETPKG